MIPTYIRQKFTDSSFRTRLLNFSIIAPPILATTFFLYSYIKYNMRHRYNFEKYTETSDFTFYIAIIFFLLVFSLLMIAMRYLQTGELLFINKFKVIPATTANLTDSKMQSDSQPNSIESTLKELNFKLDNYNKSTQAISHSILEALADNTDKLKHGIKSNLSSFMESGATNADSLSNRFNIEPHLSASRARLELEIKALGWRGNFNLIIGLGITLIGLGMLFSYLYISINAAKDPKSMLLYLIPRLSLIVLVELFAYFFLQLYHQSLNEIKYFQNELTNVEFKFAALAAAIGLGDTNTASNTISKIADTERNFILNKDQTTVELEKAKTNKDTLTALLSSISAVIKKQSK